MNLLVFKNSPFLSIIMLTSLGLTPAFAFAGPSKVTVGNREAEQPAQQDNEPAFHRKLWDGSFDQAVDQTGSVANQLEAGLEFDCKDPREEKKAGSPQEHRENWANFRDCKARERASRDFGKQARSIQTQQKVMSVVSKVSDAAAITAVGGVIYSELGTKKNNQADTYESAANIQRMAGNASYITGATDLSLGAYAYIAQKRKLESMQKTLNGGGATTDNAQLNNSLLSAVEATKKAAYAHMMYGAGKMAVGYASMWAAKRSQEQAENMNSLTELSMLNEMLAAKQQSTTAPTVTAAPLSSGAVPYYTNNQPTFTLPADGASNSYGLSANPNVVSYATPSSGASLAIPGLRNPAAIGASPSVSGSSGGGGSSTGESSGPGAPPEAPEEAKANNQKEALGSFEASLSGGMRSFAGGGGPSSATDEAPNLASLMNMGQNSKPAATGLSPTQMYSEALEGTEGTEQGSMAGVNGKSESSLFTITKEKLNKMFQVGNVGVSKNVEVKN